MSNYFSQKSAPRSSNGTDAAELALKATAVAAGLALGIEILRHRKLLFVAAVGTGVALALREKLADTDVAHSDASIDAPSYAGDHRQRATQQPLDDLDEAAMESFPASDPPASMRRNPVTELPDA